jgi:FkbM family methyltransferase
VTNILSTTPFRLVRKLGRRLIGRPSELAGSEKVLADNYRKFLRYGDWVADVGAHDGLHTREFCVIVGRAGRVIAFEPLESCYSRLQREFKRHPNVKMVKVALSNFVGSDIPFTHAAGTPQESGLKRRRFRFPNRARPREIRVDVTTLDRIIGDWPRLDYLKVDIEGAELDCLEGGEQIISRCRPIISFECGIDAYEHYGKLSSDFLDYARRHNYRIFDLFGNDISSSKVWHSVLDRGEMEDFFFVPEEQARRFGSTCGTSEGRPK